MTSFVPHPPYAEDQPYARTILTAHVLSRGFLAGSVVSLLSASVGSPIYYRLRSRTQPLSFTPRLLIHATRGSLAGTAISAFMLTGRMWEKDDIDWQDRAWRLCENEGQKQTDTWLLGGSTAGVATVVLLARGGALPAVVSGWKQVVGGAAVGSLAGLAGFIGSRQLQKGSGPTQPASVIESVKKM